MNRFVFSILCVLILKNVTSYLHCYKCEKCQEGTPDTWEVSQCGISEVTIPVNYSWACLSIDFNNKTTKEDSQLRKCILAKKIDGELRFNCPLDIGEIRSCQICDRDLCV